MTTDARSLYATALSNTHALETQGLRQMEAQVGALEHYPEYAGLLRSHIATTKQQIERLEAALGELGESSSAFKETVTRLAGQIGATVHALAQDETLKNLYAGYGYQYDQIAAYRSLIVFAERADHGGQVADFRRSIEEEKAAADQVDAVIEQVTRQYIERTLSRQKADS